MGVNIPSSASCVQWGPPRHLNPLDGVAGEPAPTIPQIVAARFRLFMRLEGTCGGEEHPKAFSGHELFLQLVFGSLLEVKKLHSSQGGEGYLCFLGFIDTLGT